MRWLSLLIVCISACACDGVHQPESLRTVAAYEIPLPSHAERERFLSLLSETATNHGMHVDAASQEELEQRAKIIPGTKSTMSAAVWRGADDEESIASAMDLPSRPGYVWLLFSKGENPQINAKFRESTMRGVLHNWPQTLSLPIMPTGAIPLYEDLIRAPNGYVVDPKREHAYALPSRPKSE